jgi:hypothetical protein
MRIITWNCSMAFRKKAALLSVLQPDLAVIQECEMPERWGEIGATSVLWHGANRHKGLAVLAFGAWRLEPVAQRDATIDYVLPAHVTGPLSFNLLGVWTKPSSIPGQDYVGQIYKAALVYQDWLAGGPSLVVGDLNSSSVFRKQPGRAHHTDVVDALAEAGMTSAYHHYHGCAHGVEAHPTWFMHKRTRSVFHLDYCFIPELWAPRLLGVTVGAIADWSPYSDHVPLIVDISF